VTVTADSLLIEGGSAILADTFGTGNAGNITVHAGELTLRSNGEISSRTYGSGNGGNVTVITDSFLIDGNNLLFPTGIFANSVDASGNAGNIMVQAGNLTMIRGAEIGSSTFYGLGHGGNVNIIADSLLIDGTGGQNAPLTGIFAASISEAYDYGVGSNSSANAGNVMVRAGNLTITGGGAIEASTFGTGDGGSVNVTADSLLIEGGIEVAGRFVSSGILATAGDLSFGGATGNAGDVTVQALKSQIIGGGEISSSTFGSGDGGTVNVTANSLLIDGTDSGISAASFTSAAAGNVVINTTGPVNLKHGGSISTLSQLGDAGSIDIMSGGEIKLKDQSSITVSAGTNGGDITITAPGQFVYLIDSSITATAGSSGSSGTGGNVTIDRPQFIVLNNSLISANAAVGQGGNIQLISDFFFNSNSSITATGTTNGTVNITAPQLDLGSELITLPISLLSAESQLQERCTALLRGDFSSFISIGRGGTEPAPEELQSTF
jgi:large exoprotein involved in heme utilization and adhesion